MRNTNQVEKMLKEIPLSEMISCIPETVKGEPKMELSIKYRYPSKAISSNIPEERIAGLQALFYKNPRKALEEIIRYRFQDNEILGAYEGDASILLPTKYHQSYRKCVSFEAGGYQIYFNDSAISIFKNTILRLDEKSKRDSFHFIKRKLESGESQHLHLSISESRDNTRNRMCMLQENKGRHSVDPINALYYYVNLKADGTLDVGDFKNMLELIEVFASMYGEFGMIHQTDTECVGYNIGSLKVTGIDTIPEMKEKIYSLRKREE